MAGIYIHIPFCLKRCYYCDFFKSTDLKQKRELIDALKIELELRKSELADEKIDTIYFGGGTPSLLSINELEDILRIIRQCFDFSPEAELTLEANPDDLNQAFLSDIRAIGFNRLSIGIQSFSDADLKLMNRRHSSLMAVQSVQWAQNVGFSNISIDLIFGLPNQTLENWAFNIQTSVGLNVQHISAYNLTYHEETVFYTWLGKKIISELSDELCLNQFQVLVHELKKAGFEHYEISNFCKPGFYSRHNSSYWNNRKYLGIGPSAHSFDLKSRRWNVSSIPKYIQGVVEGESYSEAEILSVQDKYNDYIITGLRTMWGISEAYIIENFPQNYFDNFLQMKRKYQKAGCLTDQSGQVRLTEDGLFVSDKIMTDFIFIEA
jgi:oxygen-independent coproporphyrinogen III oxidase